jgi:hypothetical protein
MCVHFTTATMIIAVPMYEPRKEKNEILTTNSKLLLLLSLEP